jgi:hypothetical protein
MKPSVPLAVPLTVVLGPSGAQAQTAVKIGILSDMSSLSRRHGRTELRGGRQDGGRRLRPREGYDGDRLALILRIRSATITTMGTIVTRPRKTKAKRHATGPLVPNALERNGFQGRTWPSGSRN